VRLSARRGGHRRGHHAGRRLLLLRMRRRRSDGQAGVLVHEMLQHGAYQPRAGRQLSGELVERFPFFALRTFGKKETKLINGIAVML